MNRTPVLSRFDMQVLKSANPTTDPAMIAIGAVVNIYRQGATTTTDKPIPSDTTSEVTLPVYNTGSVEKSPTSPPQSYLVNIDGDPTRQLKVTDVSPSAMTIKVTNTTTTGFLLLAGSRLVMVSPAANFYRDPLGINSLGSSLTVNPANGFVGAYTREYRFDIIVTGVSPELRRLFVDQVGSFVMR